MVAKDAKIRGNPKVGEACEWVGPVWCTCVLRYKMELSLRVVDALVALNDSPARLIRRPKQRLNIEWSRRR